MGEGFSNPVAAGGGALIRNSVHSPDYTATVDGWSINQDGSAEFNNISIRGSGVVTDLHVQGDLFVDQSATVIGDFQATGFTEVEDLQVNGVGQVRYVVAASPESVSNNATVQDDNELVLALAASASYEVEFWVYFQTGVNCDIRTDWAVPAGATGLKACLGATSASGGYVSRENTAVRIGAHGFATDVGYQLETGAVDQLCYEKGIVTTGGTAGNIQFRWSQFTATVGNLTRDSNSYMRVTRIA